MCHSEASEITVGSSENIDALAHTRHAGGGVLAGVVHAQARGIQQLQSNAGLRLLGIHLLLENQYPHLGLHARAGAGGAGVHAVVIGASGSHRRRRVREV